MGIRMDQHMGFTDAGREFIDNHAEIAGTRITKEVYESGEERILSIEPIYVTKEYDEFRGAYDPFPLREFTARDGSVFREAVQASPWSSGPMIFMALQNENGEWIEETLWDEEEINSTI